GLSLRTGSHCLTAPNARRMSPGFDKSAGMPCPMNRRTTSPPYARTSSWSLRSRSDRLTTLQEKMEEYLDNGARLGWLIDPLEKKVHIYRPGFPVEVLENPPEISGDPLLKGFVLRLDGILA